MKYYCVIISFMGFCVASCKLTNDSVQNQNVIYEACELADKINDTIVVRGTYSTCMEYSSFNPVKSDECYDAFDMDLRFNQAHFTKEVEARLDEMYGCGVSIKLTLRGILRKEKDRKYGHLGSNTAEFDVLDFIEYGKVKFKKLKN
ncbi:hypothetical protein [Flagellimonas algicola]|uniref:Lipoprotein n=1 Tax=Flagellimonas algicola TaxID=2583815 RepID=A0ABY2WLQ3_9FLAO|nr:hypothetical protein [Allomuricauda algicola]TMU55532.1 hypothetical protein FGG15_15305 [Allomuricauda algicola]